jgi:acetyl esterase/lipase
MDFKELPFDSELQVALHNLPPYEELVKVFTLGADSLPPTVAHEEFELPGPDNTTLKVSVLRKKGSDMSQKHVGIYHIHGGGMIVGTRFTTLEWPLSIVLEMDAVCVTVEYRLAPANPDPALVEDCYAGLVWMYEHAVELGIDTTKILIQGISSGGGLVAGVSLLLRDRAHLGPKPLGQLLFSPMLDDRCESLSCRQFEKSGVWNLEHNVNAWSSVLGDRRGTDKVSIYAAPARATNLSSLPTTYLDVGSTDIFRDEDVTFAQNLWRCGVNCELHVWPGGFHGFEAMAPKSRLSTATNDVRRVWLKRLLEQPT